MTASERNVVLVSHLPGFSMEADEVQFLYSNSTLRRLSFEQYESLTKGAHDRRREYDDVKPVFCVTHLSVELSKDHGSAGQRAVEMKLPSASEDFLDLLPRSDLVSTALDLAMSAWKCLSLALPMSGLISPRHSTTFVHAQGDGCFLLNGQPASTLQIQGDADHEYLLARKFVVPTVPPSRLELAESRRDLLQTIQDEPALRVAFSGFLQSQEPALSPVEQAILCVIQLERLLLGRQTSSLRQGFAHRGSQFIPATQRSLFAERHVRALYDLRSAYLHGRVEEDIAKDRAILALAPALLASVIASIAAAMKKGQAFREIVAADENALAKIALQDDWQGVDGFRPDNRFSDHRQTTTARVGGTMGAPKDKSVLWSPLLGLEVAGDALRVGGVEPEAVMPLSIEELVEIEDREIRQDFLAGLRARAALTDGELDHGRAVLMTILNDAPLEQGRLLSMSLMSVQSTIIALRALGFHNFIDPQLLGDYYYSGVVRIRRPTVYRQTLLHRHIEKADSISAAEMENVGGLRDLVLQNGPAFPGLLWSLGMFRKSFFHPVIAAPLRARLAFAFIESTVGRFNGEKREPRLEDLAERLAPGERGSWFRKKARALRNELAHAAGAKVEDEELAQLQAFSSLVALELIRHMAAPGVTEQIFAKTFREALLAK